MNRRPFAGTVHRWIERPLCRRYATVVFCQSMVALADRASGSSPTIWWALGTLNEGGAEFLGAWKNVDESAGPPTDLFGQLAARGVLSIRFCIGNLGGAEAAFSETLRHAAVIPSVEELLALSAALARPRHRPALHQQLRFIAELDELAAMRKEFAEFQGSKLGERYPEIVLRWEEALARFQPFYALHAPLRELVRSADRTAADVSERLNRAIKRHGPFTDSDAALEFVVAWLDNAERGLARGRSAASVLSTVASSLGRGVLPATVAVGVPKSA